VCFFCSAYPIEPIDTYRFTKKDAACWGNIYILINIKDFFFFKKGVSLTISEQAKPKLFERMRNTIKSGSFSSIVLAAITLGVMANIYELFCTPGFPMI